MKEITLNEWIEQLRARFDQRELTYREVHHASISLQLKDLETGEIHLHALEYTGKNAERLTVKICS